MYRRWKAPYNARGQWRPSGRYGTAGKRGQKNATRRLASVIGWNIERLLGVR